MCGSGTVARSLNHEASLVFAWAMFWSKGGAKIGPEGLRDVVCSASGCVTLLIDNWRVQMRSKIPVKSLGWLHDLIWCCFHVELGWGLVETSYLRSPGMNHSGATTSLNWIAEEMPRWISTSTLPAMIFSANRQIWQQSNMIRRHVHMVRFGKLMRFFCANKRHQWANTGRMWTPSIGDLASTYSSWAISFSLRIWGQNLGFPSKFPHCRPIQWLVVYYSITTNNRD